VGRAVRGPRENKQVLRKAKEGEIDRMLIRIVDRNRNLKSSKTLLKAKRTRVPAYSRALRRIKGFFQRVVKRSSGPITRGPGGDRVAVKVGAVQMGRVNDQMGLGRNV